MCFDVKLYIFFFSKVYCLSVNFVECDFKIIGMFYIIVIKMVGDYYLIYFNLLELWVCYCGDFYIFV